MSPNGDKPRNRGSKSPSLPERVAQLYYSHGLFCSTYPTVVISIAISVILLCCYPLINLPLSGSIPLQIWNPDLSNRSIITPLGEEPWCYVQQVVLRTAVLPWDENLTLGDAFRAPLYEAFKLLDLVRNYQDSVSGKTLGHVCLHVDSVKKPKNFPNVLPEYSCLVLSPANLWRQDAVQFSLDTSILSTIFNQQNLQKGKTSIAEMLFGMHLTDTGIKRYPLRNRQRILQFAITMFFKEYDESFISGLRSKLEKTYPLYQNLNTTNSTYLNNTILIHYAGDINYFEYIPLAIAFIILFAYYYFSVRKIELIKSKLGMAFTVVMTVLGSLSMTIGICFFFGLTFSMQGKEIFPYFIILVGIENVLVLTKSVDSTSPHLDIKIRVAQGLSKEGWSITKNLLLELTILTVGIFTFVPVIQEFCIFSVVGLLTDFFLQMFFFSTVLAVDSKRGENLNDKASVRTNLYQPQTYVNKSFSPKIIASMPRSKSHPRLNTMHTDVVATQAQGAHEKKIPKRLQLVTIWARTRFFQRAFMILMVIWISMIVYNSDLMEKYFIKLPQDNIVEKNKSMQLNSKNFLKYNTSINLNSVLNKSESLFVEFVTPMPDMRLREDQLSEFTKLKHPEYPPWLRLSTQHWPSILRKYNLSLSGKCIALLPNIRISHVISPEEAVAMRNPEDKFGQKFQWQALAAALDPIDFMDIEGNTDSKFSEANRPFYPTSPMEIFLTTILCFISSLVLAYVFVVLYRCICSRNYAEWRASWSKEKTVEDQVPVLLEAVPIVLEGHSQEVECMATDGTTIVSSCLGGTLKVWDTTGELLAYIDRKKYFTGTEKTPELVFEQEEGNYSDYESGSPPSRDEYIMSFPSLQHKINVNFSNLKNDKGSSLKFEKEEKKEKDPKFERESSSKGLKIEKKQNTPGFDFGEDYRQLYLNHEQGEKVRRRGGKGKKGEDVKWINFLKQINIERQINTSSNQCDNSNSDETKKKIESEYLEENFNLNKTSNKINNESVNSFNYNDDESKSDHVNFCRVSSFIPSNIKYLNVDNINHNSVNYNNFSSSGNINMRDSPVWCLDYLDNLIVVGCSSGRIEVWEGTTGKFKCMYDDESGVGVTGIKIIGSRVIASRLYGSLDFLQLQTYNQGRPIDWNFTSAYRRTHMRTGSTGSIMETKDFIGQQEDSKEDMRFIKIISKKAHQQQIACLETEGGRVVTGSQDHTLKVFRLEDGGHLYTLHGHCGPITCLFIDRVTPATSGSGSQDGMLCIWDLLTGTCVYNIQAHNGSITSLTYSASYIISLGSDERLCVWERFQGHILKTIHFSAMFTSNILMLTPNLIVAAKAGGLTICDVQNGETVRNILLGHTPLMFVKQLLMLRDAVLCDFGNQMRIIRFPLISQKVD